MTWISDSIAVGCAPMSYADFDSIKACGIDAIVNLCAEFSDLHELEKNAGFEVYYLPVWDEDIPEMRDMENALSWLDESVYLGKKVLVHCRHGIGRTGTFVTSYMIRKGMGLKDAAKKLKSSKANPSSYGQWKLLKKYGRKSGVLKIREPSLEVKNRVDLSSFFFDYEALVQDIDKKIQRIFKNDRDYEKTEYDRCGNGHKNMADRCCMEDFNLQLMEVLYLYSNINRHFTSDQREILIKRAVSVLKKDRTLCPFNDGTRCALYDIRPVRCRTYGIKRIASDLSEINSMLFHMSRDVFLALSGTFLQKNKLLFSVAELVSGKFVQRYFNYMAEFEKNNSGGRRKRLINDRS